MMKGLAPVLAMAPSPCRSLRRERLGVAFQSDSDSFARIGRKRRQRARRLLITCTCVQFLCRWNWDAHPHADPIFRREISWRAPTCLGV